jgi:Arc/MetJ-type ribon-helix-helix transcriptional regulator
MTAEPRPAEGEYEQVRDLRTALRVLDEHAPDEVARLLESSAMEDSTREVLRAFAALQPVIHRLHAGADMIRLPLAQSVEVSDQAGLHGSPASSHAAPDRPALTPAGLARKVSVSMPQDLTAAVQQRVGRGKFSQYVTEAVTRQLELDLLAELSDLLSAEHGPVPEAALSEARSAWPDA